MGKASKKAKPSVRKAFTNKAVAAMQKIAGGEVQLSTSPSQAGKISDALQTLLAMEVEDDWPLANLQSALGLVVLAWNISLHDAEQRAELVQQFVGEKLSHLHPDILSDLIGNLKRIILIKEALFPDDRRTVVSYEVTRNRSGFVFQPLHSGPRLIRA